MRWLLADLTRMGNLARFGDWGHMGGWGWGMAILGWMFMLGVLGLVTWLVVSATRSAPRNRPTALDVLDERYARGEIDREEYVQRRADLER